MNLNHSTSVSSAEFKSRWGHHPCDHGTYAKLKRLNHLVEKVKRLAASQWRYDQKTANKGVRWERLCRDGRPIGRRRVENVIERPQCPLPYLVIFRGDIRRPAIDCDWVGELYRAARTPNASPVVPLDDDAVARAIDLLNALEGSEVSRSGLGKSLLEQSD